MRRFSSNLLCMNLAFLLISAGSGCAPDGVSEGAPPAAAASPPAPQTNHPVVVREPPPLRGVAALADQSSGDSVRLACHSCHSVRPANRSLKNPADLVHFHQGMQMAHGGLTCVSCHNAEDDYDTLKLADGRAAAFTDSIQLCAQCHGTQYRDYQHGAHGGMTGHWDLTRGGRVRNHCIHCHDPHSPKFPTYLPAAPPRDRISPAPHGEPHE